MDSKKARAVQLANFGFWLVCVVLAVNAMRLWISNASAQVSSAGALYAVPYTVIVNDTIVLRDGSRQINGELVTAVRGDGARAIRYERKQGPPSISRTIDYAGGLRSILDEVNRVKSTTRSASRGRPWLRDTRSNCVAAGQTFAGVELVAGYRAARVHERNTTFWFAPDYGCALIRPRIDWGAGGQTEQVVSALIPGAPAAELFEAPANYREVLPSELRRLTSLASHDERTREILAKETSGTGNTVPSGP